MQRITPQVGHSTVAKERGVRIVYDLQKPLLLPHIAQCAGYCRGGIGCRYGPDAAMPPRNFKLNRYSYAGCTAAPQ